jgi:DNA-binding transcriptional regulator LsrR (DeoR family)
MKEGRTEMSEALQIAMKAVQLYAETHPRPIQVTQKQAAEMLGKSEVTVSRMVKAGTIKLNSAGMIPISEIDRVLQPRAA